MTPTEMTSASGHGCEAIGWAGRPVAVLRPTHRERRRGYLGFISTATLLAVIACASTHGGTGVGSLRAAPPAIEVTNDRYDYVVVYLIHSGAQFELGVVPAMSRRTFTPSASQLGTGVMVTPGSGPRGAAMNHLTLPLTLLPGSYTSWTVREKWIEQPVVR